MAKTRKVQMSFGSGIISPVLDGRLDLFQAQQGVRTMRNLIAAREGGAIRRAGLRFIGSLKGRGLGEGGSASGGTALRSGSFAMSPRVYVQAGIPSATVWSWYFTLDLTEVSAGRWSWETHGYVSWTGTNPPFDAGDVWIQTSSVPNSSGIVSRYENNDQLITWSTSARSGINDWPDSTTFYAYLQYYAPGFGWLDSFQVNLLDIVS